MTTVAELWTRYHGDTPPRVVYARARGRRTAWKRLHDDLTAVDDAHDDDATPEAEAAWQERRGMAQAALLRHDGVPGRWIDTRGVDVAPATFCRVCWEPGGVDIDECGGCTGYYHPACYVALSVRANLAAAAHAHAIGDTREAAKWERIALTRHDEATPAAADDAK